MKEKDDRGVPGGDPPGQDDTYVLEDTGESLEDFDVSEVDVAETAAGQAASASRSPADQDLALENQKLKDQLMRRMAEFENFRKRSEREKSDYYKYALTDVMRELVPVLDNFERALASAGNDVPVEFLTGIEMISRQLTDILQRSGVRVLGEANVPFDPAIHEAVMRVEDPSVPAQTVVEVLQKGYFLNDRLIRPALVKVAVGGSEKPKQQSDT